MSAIGIPNQGAFLSSLGFNCESKPEVLARESSEANMRNLALLVSNLRASRQSQEPTASSKIDSIERVARKTRAALSLRFQLISTELPQGEKFNPLETIRNRAKNNFHAIGSLWNISNDEMLHDLAYRSGCERAPTHHKPQNQSPYPCPLQKGHGSQFLISRLQEKHTHDNAHGMPIHPPQITISGPDTQSSWSSAPSEEEPEFLTVESIPKSVKAPSVRTTKSGRSGDDDILSDFSFCPSDKYLECASNELEYISSVLQAALRQHKSREAPSSQRHCHIYTKTLQESLIPKHLEFLADSERSANSMYHEIERSIVNPTESLKLETDRMIADINTSLNLKLRDCATMMSDLERCGHSDCLKRLSYRVLEVAVFIILRSIWVVVSIWRLIQWVLVNCGVFSPSKPRTIPCVCPTPLPSLNSTPNHKSSKRNSTT